MAHANNADGTPDPKVTGTNVKLTSANQASEIKGTVLVIHMIK